MPTIETNANGLELVRASDDHGTYYYLCDGMGQPFDDAWSDEDEARHALYEEPGAAPDVMIDELGRRLVRCAYCHAEVPFESPVPDEADDAAWAGLEARHVRGGCEWVETRAHRREAV